MPRGNVVNPPCAPCQARSSSVISAFLLALKYRVSEKVGAENDQLKRMIILKGLVALISTRELLAAVCCLRFPVRSFLSITSSYETKQVPELVSTGFNCSQRTSWANE